jgi:2-oxoglutarate dehydrogenase E1 component
MRDEQKLFYAGRTSQAAPAGGYLAKHNERQKALVDQAFGKFKSS